MNLDHCWLVVIIIIIGRSSGSGGDDEPEVVCLMLRLLCNWPVVATDRINQLADGPSRLLQRQYDEQNRPRRT